MSSSDNVYYTAISESAGVNKVTLVDGVPHRLKGNVILVSHRGDGTSERRLGVNKKLSHSGISAELFSKFQVLQWWLWLPV